MRIPSLLIVFALFGSSPWAHGQDDGPWYMQLGLGGVFSETADDVPGGSVDFDPGFEGSLALGYTLDLSERLDFDIEGELLYQYFTVDEDGLVAIPSAVEDDAKTVSLMINGNVDWHFTPQYWVYGGVGIGYAKEVDYSAWDSGNLTIDDADGPAFQARFGFGYNLGGSYDVRLGYRFFKTDTVDIEDTTAGTTSELDIAQHSIEALFRWGL